MQTVVVFVNAIYHTQAGQENIELDQHSGGMMMELRKWLGFANNILTTLVMVNTTRCIERGHQLKLRI